MSTTDLVRPDSAPPEAPAPTPTAPVPAPATPPATGPATCGDGVQARAAAIVAASGGSWLTIAETAERTGVTVHTLRYYERIGLVDVPRDAAGRRRYWQAEIARVVFVTRLRLTAMPIRDIQAYFRLVAQGPQTEPERLAVLERHRDQVKARICELEAALGVVEMKIAAYGGAGAP
ncbi:MAG TPA: MerR family transcriptional regulator [Acidimicrobiales bacterium]